MMTGLEHARVAAASRRHRRVRATRALLLLVLWCAACARASPPSAELPQRPFPDMGGRAVMLLPLQNATPLVALTATADTTRAPAALDEPVRAAVEAELAYWLPSSGPRVQWVLPAAVERAVQRSPAIEVRVRDLAIRDFLRARMTQVGDPLYGELRRLAVLLDARYALLPIGAVWLPEQGGGGRIHVALALIDTLGGAVLWSGVAAGTAGAIDDPAVAASAAEAVARLIPR
ncbi:MAG TPA: hypothetical protein VMN60_04365 [Longimicrobiales bacterium]|nr:hypothetical protein [Longimicrobiales bacterium]